MKRLLLALLAPCAALAVALKPLRRLWAHARFAAQMAHRLDPSVVLEAAPEVHGTGRIRMGKGLYIYPGLYLETRGAGSIDIGHDVVISRGAHIVSYAGISIGDQSMIGEYVSIRDANHKFGDRKTLRTSGHTSKPIWIGRNVWIGRGAVVLPGVCIGDNAVIGANAVVTRDVEEGAVMVGVPAKPAVLKGAA